MNIRTILHPTDFSESSGCAFRLACSLARDYGARVPVLHVTPPPATVVAGVMTPPPSPDYRGEAMEQLRQLAPPDPAVTVEHRLEEGDPATEILRVARAAGFDLLALGTHGRGGLSRLLMGSVAEKVLRGAHCPVLTVKFQT